MAVGISPAGCQLRADHDLEELRQFPGGHEGRAQFGIGKAEHPALRLKEGGLSRRPCLKDFPIAIRLAAVEHQAADAVHEARQEQALAFPDPDLVGQQAGHDAAGGAVVPEGGHVHELLGNALEGPGDRRGQNQVAQGPLADQDDGMGDPLHMTRPAEKGTVGQAQHPGRQGGVQFHHLRQLAGGMLGIPDQIVHP